MKFSEWLTLKENRHLSTDEILNLFNYMLKNQQVGEFGKFAKVYIRPSIPGEKVDTIVGGQVETTNTGKSDTFTVQALGGDREKWVISAKQLANRYHDPKAEPRSDVEVNPPPGAQPMKLYLPKGRVLGFELPPEVGPITFKASWGEDMIAKPGDFIVHPSDDPTDIYRIVGRRTNSAYRVEKDAWRRTYKQVPKPSMLGGKQTPTPTSAVNATYRPRSALSKAGHYQGDINPAIRGEFS